VLASARLRPYLPWTSAVLIGLLRTGVGMAAISSGAVSAAEAGPGWLAPPGRALKELAGLDDRELVGIVRLLPRAGRRRTAACDLLVTRHQGLVRSCVRPYPGSLEPAEGPDAGGVYRPAEGAGRATGRPAPREHLVDYLGKEDPRLERMLVMQSVATHWGELPRLEQEILVMDFRGGMTQTQISQRLRISQMRVSRLRAHALSYLRLRLFGLEETRASTAPEVASQPSKGHEPATGADHLCGGLGRISGTAAPATAPDRQDIAAIRAGYGEEKMMNRRRTWRRAWSYVSSVIS
jgi:sigma-70-like protein